MIILDETISKFRKLHQEGKSIEVILDSIHPRFYAGESSLYKKASREFMNKIPIKDLFYLKYSDIDKMNIPPRLKREIKSYKVLGMCFSTSLAFYYLMGMKDLKGNPYHFRKWINKDQNLKWNTGGQAGHYWIYSDDEGIIDITKEQIPLLKESEDIIYNNYTEVKRFRGEKDGSMKIKIYNEEIKIGKGNYDLLRMLKKKLN